LDSEFISLVPRASLFDISKATICIPIPLHPARFRSRGFNQAEVLGKLIAARLNIPVRTDILRWVKLTTPQVSMKTREERLGNMKKVFQTVQTVQNMHIILFDDVFTTGATMRSAANTLKRAGAKSVWAVTVAR
jgi:ComF family protein